ncbi:MAG: FMN-binding protein [Planctomycetota bacterium]|jgi:Na+-transporting NADH:ubiquinone oxidoreductase subunit C
MIRKQAWFPVLYMFCVTALFSSIVIGFTRITGERVEANQMLAFEKAVLTVLPGLYEGKLSRLETHNKFIESVDEPDASSGEAYTLKEGGKIIAYALPISGRGFWAPIKGIIGIKADGRTITGIAFYEQNETPGLGAEITRESFRNQFRGKEISDSDEPINIRRPGATLSKNDVHAVTGATQTCNRVENIINMALKKWRTEVVKSTKTGK